MKKLKGFSKLYLQVLLLGATLIGVSFFTETEIWLKYFNTLHTIDHQTFFETCHKKYNHYHWNYRGVIYVLTGTVLTFITIFKITKSHKEEDFEK